MRLQSGEVFDLILDKEPFEAIIINGRMVVRRKLEKHVCLVKLAEWWGTDNTSTNWSDIRPIVKKAVKKKFVDEHGEISFETGRPAKEKPSDIENEAATP